MNAGDSCLPLKDLVLGSRLQSKLLLDHRLTENFRRLLAIIKGAKRVGGAFIHLIDQTMLLSELFGFLLVGLRLIHEPRLASHPFIQNPSTREGMRKKQNIQQQLEQRPGQ